MFEGTLALPLATFISATIQISFWDAHQHCGSRQSPQF